MFPGFGELPLVKFRQRRETETITKLPVDFLEMSLHDLYLIDNVHHSGKAGLPGNGDHSNQFLLFLVFA